MTLAWPNLLDEPAGTIARPDAVPDRWPSLPTGELLDGARTIPYTVRPSPRCRFMRLTIRPDTGLVATVPIGSREDELARFLRRHHRWIVRETQRMSRLAQRIPKRWPYGATLPYRGDEHPVIVEPGPRPASVNRTAEARLLVRMPVPGIEGARRALKRWYLAEASRWLLTRTTEIACALGISWRRVRVRDQRYRWGSCSAAGYLNFNYRLVMAPPVVMDYVVLHELCHRRELNHSGRFWALVEARCPDYRTHLDWLKTEGAYLAL